MIWPELQGVAQIAVGRILNSLPEGVLIALFTWGMLRLLPRQNSGTRFAVWFLALLTIVALPCIGFAGAHSLLAPSSGHSLSLFVLPDRLGIGIFLIWLLAASIAILRLAVGLWHLRSLRRNSSAIDPSQLDPRLRKTIADFSAYRSVTLAASEHVTVPAAIGFFRPMIVLPGWALKELPAEELRVILLHEFAHLQRWDDWTNLLQKMVRAVFLFHPAVWWIDSKLALEREMACDDVVLAETGNPRGYAQCLISLLERNFARRGWAMAQAVVHRAHEASLRLARILDATRPTGKRVWKPALAAASAFSVICFAVLARAPQFVAFQDRTAPSSQRFSATEVVSTAATGFHLGHAAVVPAALRVDPASSFKRTYQLRTSRRRVAPQTIQPAAANRPLESPEAGKPTEALVVAVKAAENQPPAAEQTLLLIRTTERLSENLWVSSVFVYRLDWKTPSASQAKPEPVKPAAAETRPAPKTT
jgi:beta-lactamase regulating signal transducer with metallopeptidase domain